MRTFLFLCLLVGLSACTSSTNTGGVKEGELLSFDVTKLSDEVHTVYFSELMESVEFFQLDTVPEAFSGKSRLVISDNYLLTISVRTTSKLYRRSDGKYLSDISREGQGPGEYWVIEEAIIDERNERVYILDGHRDYLMAFDFNGMYLPDKNIPLPTFSNSGRIYLDKDSVLVFIAPTEVGITNIQGKKTEKHADKHLCWKQDLKGNVSKSVPADRVIMPIKKRPSNVLYTFHLSDESPIYAYTIHQRDVYKADTLYHYNIEENRFYPAYTTNFFQDKNTLTASAETPLHYYTNHQTYKKSEVNDGGKLKNVRMIQVDKKTGKGRYVRIVNDLIDGGEMYPLYFPMWIKDNGLLVNYHSDPLDLKDRLEEYLKKNTRMEASLRERLTKLKDSLNADSNDVIFIYTFKKQ